MCEYYILYVFVVPVCVYLSVHSICVFLRMHVCKYAVCASICVCMCTCVCIHIVYVFLCNTCVHVLIIIPLHDDSASNCLPLLEDQFIS